MESEKKAELKKYLMPSMVGAYSGLVMVVLGIVFSFFSTSGEGILMLFLIMAVTFSAKPLLQLWELSGYLADAQEEGTLEAVYEDFEQGEKLINGRVRLGKIYIMGQGGVVPSKIEDIEQVYEYIHRTNGAVDRHQLMLRLENGDKQILCALTSGRPDPQSALPVYVAIKLRKPDVKIGA